MQQQTLEVIYEGGVFRPIMPPASSIEEGQHLHVLLLETLTPEEMTELAGSVYDGLPEEEIKEIERIALDRSSFFGDRAP